MDHLSKSPELSDLTAARDHAWEWFKYHADQRMKVLNFFLLITAALTTGFVTTVVAKQYLAAFFLAFLELVVIGAFFQLDRRSAALVKIGERYLDIAEDSLANKIHAPELRFLRAADYDTCSHWSKKIVYTYRQVLQGLFVVMGLLALLGLGLTSCMLLNFPAASTSQPDSSSSSACAPSARHPENVPSGS